MSEQEKMKRKIWSKEETQGFLYCYHAHKDEFYHSRKKKFAYENVLKDMIDQGYTSPLTTTTALEGKMRTLLMAYKTAKTNATPTPCIAPFIDVMDEIFEDNPLFTNNLTLMDSTNNKSTHTDTSDEDKSQISLHIQQVSESADEEEMPGLLDPKSEWKNTINQQMPDNKRKMWTKEETLGLLYCYHARQDEFCHSRKKKSAYANVLKDMIDQGFTNPTTTATALESKMRKLLVAFKLAKENSYKSSPSPGIAPFMSEMEEIFGDRPIFSNSHKTHMRKVSTAKKTANGDSSDEDQADSLDEEQLPTMPTHSIHLSSLDPFPNPDPLSTVTLVKKKSAQENFFDSQLKLKKEEIGNRQLMREARHEQREKFMRESLNALQKKWERDHELDMKKLELLEKLIEK